MPDTGDNQYDYKKLDSLLNSPIRLAIVSLLVSTEEADFTFIRDKIGATDGNLSRHLLKLEESGLIEVRKDFDGKKPVTYQKVTDEGRKALREYIARLEELILSIKK